MKNCDVFGVLPERVLNILEDSLSEIETFDSNEFIISRSSISKYLFFVKRGSCTIELINEHSIYEQNLVIGDVFGFETLVSSTYESTVVANAMVIVMKVKKVCLEKIMDTFPEFEESFWKKYLFSLYKMFVNRDSITFHLSHLEEDEFKELIKNFQLIRLEVGEHTIKSDTIFLRGACKYS